MGPGGHAAVRVAFEDAGDAANLKVDKIEERLIVAMTQDPALTAPSLQKMGQGGNAKRTCD